MSVLELHELVKALEGHWGVSAAAVAVAGRELTAAAEEKTHLTSSSLMQVLKRYRSSGS